MSTLSFLGCVNIGVKLVQKQYSDAELYEVVADPSKPWEPVSSPNKLTKLKIVFNTMQGGKQGTAIINSASQWGEFGDIEYKPKPWLEDIVIPWPLKGQYSDPIKADAHMKEEGYTKDYTSMTLRHPLYPDPEEPEYIFHMTDKSWVSVGVETGKIETEAGQLASKK